MYAFLCGVTGNRGIVFGEPYEVGRGVLIKVSDEILQELSPANNVPQISALLRDEAQRMLQSQRGSHRVRCRTNSADSLREIHGVKRIPALQHFLKVPEKQVFASLMFCLTYVLDVIKLLQAMIKPLPKTMSPPGFF